MNSEDFLEKNRESDIESLLGQITSLNEKILELENELKKIKGGRPIEEIKTMERIEAKNFIATGGFTPEDNYTVIPPYVIANSTSSQDKKQRQASFGMASNNENTPGETIQAIIGANINIDPSQVPADLTKADWESIKIGQIVLDYRPFSPLKQSFVYGFTTPLVISKQRGTIVQGGNTLTDPLANFPTNSLAFCVINLFDNNFSTILESYLISQNTKDTITINGTWKSPSGVYSYLIFTPLMLGAAGFPFRRLYVGEMIRLGYGGTDTSQPIKIVWGSGSPEGVVTANPGSLYLRTDGGSSTTLYVKETGSGNTGWVAK